MPGWWVGGVEIVLGAAAVILTGVAIGVAILAFLGYRDIKAAAIRAAKIEGRRVAEDAAAREMRAFLDKQSPSPDISTAYRDGIGPGHDVGAV